jgi:Uri superfamily endonuclease
MSVRTRPKAAEHPGATRPSAPRAAAGHTSYQLLIDVPRRQRVQVGRLGEFEFPAGRYVYTGSAKRNLAARIARHLRRQKALRWHIDYLLAAPGVRVKNVVTAAQPECALNRGCGGQIVAAGFGASDCRCGCGAHLKYFGRQPARASAPALRADQHGSGRVHGS